MSKDTLKGKGSLRGTSIYEIGREVRRTDSKGKVPTNSPTIVEGLKPLKVNFKEGRHILSPNQLAALLVPRQEVSDGKIHGFQRPKIIRPHIRRIAESIEAGDPIAEIIIAQYKNSLWLVEGQHRSLGAILARRSIPAIIRKLNAEEMRKLFASQDKAKKVNPSVITLSANDDFSRYVQDAVVNNKNPWNKLVTSAASSQKKMTPKQMLDSIGPYVGSTLGRHPRDVVGSTRFDQDKAEELALLFSVFGNKQTNPNAFRPIGIRAITYASTLIIRRNGSKKEDIDRWVNWMPQFQFNEYLGIRRSKELAMFLIRHWNKRLSTTNRIKLPNEIM